MESSEWPEGYRDSLLFQHCQTEERYREAIREMQERKELERQRHVRASLKDYLSHDPPPLFAAADPRGPQPPRSAATAAAPPPAALTVQRFAAFVNDYPDAVRAILAGVVLDIVEEFFGGNNSELEGESQSPPAEGEGEAQQ